MFNVLLYLLRCSRENVFVLEFALPDASITKMAKRLKVVVQQEFPFNLTWINASL